MENEEVWNLRRDYSFKKFNCNIVSKGVEVREGNGVSSFFFVLFMF